MMNPEQFRRAADQALGGLKADPALLHRARQLAATQRAQPRRANRVLAMAMSMALVFGVLTLVLPRLNAPRMNAVDTLAAGGPSLQGMRTTADLPRGSLVLSGDSQPKYQGVWERGSGGNFPLLRLDGRYYRLLSHPEDVTDLLGAQLGQVVTFTDEPALDAGNALLSNVAPQGTPVYEVTGLGRAALAAQVNGRARLFQRVAFAGSGLLSGETLRDTLPSGAIALQLSDVGTVQDAQAVSSLMNLLYTQAAYQGAGTQGGSQTLLVQYGNGVVLQLAVSGDSLSAAGTWSCPAFFEAFAAALP
ncbi:MAG: hypothetical protein GXY84_09755 [Clostridiales bacterium]|nr:hypothetical protein [Clostridiales bacterium]